MTVPTIGRESELEALTRLVEEGEHVLVTGPAGIGKSRLLSALSHDLEAAGYGVARVSGMPGGDAIPFGAVSHLLDETTQADRTWLLRSLKSKLSDLGDDRGLLISVDDLDLLDSSTLALIQMFVAEREAVIIATLRAEKPAEARSPAIRGANSWLQFPLEHLDRAATVELAEEILEGNVSVGLASRIWGVTTGNPLFVCEILAAGQRSGTVVERDGLFDQSGELSAPESLQNLVENRTHDLGDEERSILYAVALSEPGHIDVISSLGGMEPLVSLERRGLIEVQGSGEDAVIQTSHPLIGETVRSRLGPLERRAMIGELSRMSMAAGKRVDTLRLATWQLETGESIEPELAINAAGTALNRFDHELTLMILESTATAEYPEALLLQGKSLVLDGKPRDAESALRKALAASETPNDRAAAAAALAETYLLALANPARAIETLEGVMFELEDVNLSTSLEALAQLAAAYAGDFKTTLKRAPELLDLHLSPQAEVPTRMIYTLGQTMTGHLDGVLDGIDRAESLLPQVRTSLPLARDQLGMNRVLALQALGRLIDAGEVVDRVIASKDFSYRLQGPWLYVDALNHVLSGDLDAAVTRIQESIRLQRETDPIGIVPMAMGVGGMGLAMRGDIREARSAVSEARAHPSSWPVRAAIWIELAEAWIEASDGNVEAAAQRALDTGDMAITGTHVVWGAIAYHSAVRMGFPEEAAKKMSSLEGGPLVDALTEHAIAAASRRPDDLRHVSGVMVGVGAMGIAADARAAASLAASDGERARDAVAARVLYALHPSYSAPLRADLPAPLSARQTEVAGHAARGLPTRDIAERLYITPKTVDNHLQAVYRALHLSNRNELTDLFL